MGVFHVHHAPSHDSDAPFEELLAAALAAELDFVVLTEHAEPGAPGPLPAIEHAGVHADASGRRVLVLVGVEVGTSDGHLIALGVPHTPAADGRTGREVIDEIHALGGFAVVPHPFAYGGWRDWEAPFDGLEVQNNASDFRALLGPALPLHLLRLLLDPAGLRERAWRRPARELERWEALLAEGRPVVALAGADAHRNVGWAGLRLDPYEPLFRAIQMHCPAAPLEPAAVLARLTSGRCRIRYRVYDARAGEARSVRFPSGREELQLDAGRRVLEIRPPPARPL